MKRIYKYPVVMEDDFELVLPAGAIVLSVQGQKGMPVMWALVDADRVEHRKRKFHVYGTGNPLPDNVGSFTFIGTFQLVAGALVFHLFEET